MKYVSLLLVMTCLAGCNQSPSFVAAAAGSSGASFALIQKNILGPKCTQCHSQSRTASDVSFATYEETIYSPGAVVPYQPWQSQIFQQCYSGQMPPRRGETAGVAPLTNADLQSLYDWIALGAPNN